MNHRNAKSLFALAITSLCFSGAASPSLAQSHCPSEASLRSASGTQETQIKFKNEKRGPINIFWIDYNGRRKFYQMLPPGQSERFNTYATHPWVVTDAGGDCLGVWFADVGSAVVAIR